ncbi:MAG: hypothetical protein WCP35_21980 [Verrucomicrobiota bacterium]
MSNFTTLESPIRDLVALVHACVGLNLDIVPEAWCRGHGGSVLQAEYVIRLRGPHDIAVDPSSEIGDSYVLTADWQYGHVAREVGVGFCDLLQAYDFHRTRRQREAQALGLGTTDGGRVNV